MSWSLDLGSEQLSPVMFNCEYQSCRKSAHGHPPMARSAFNQIRAICTGLVAVLTSFPCTDQMAQRSVFRT
jgi:hypothetical protein